MAYFSNSTDGDKLQQQCDTCPAGAINEDRIDVTHYCPIRIVQDLNNYDQLKKGNEKLKAAMEVLIDEKLICQMLPILIPLVAPPTPKGEPPGWLFEEPK